MSENNEQENQVIDFGYDVVEADVKKPLLKKQTLPAKLLKVYQAKPNANNNTFLVLEWEITVPIPRNMVVGEAKDIPAGFRPWPQRVMMNPAGKLTEEMIREKVQKIHFALAGEGRVNTGAWVNKEAALQINLREAHKDEKTGEDREASNEIGAVLPLKK